MPSLTLRFAYAATAVAILAGCATHVRVEPRLPRPDVVTRPALAAYMRSTTSPTIVLRVPAPQGQVAQSQAQQGDAAANQIYNLIEKELVKANFAVRDRGLLDAIVRSGQNLDYPLILQRTNAQLILEIISIRAMEYNNDGYSRVKNNEKGRLESGAFPISGWQYECKVTMVSTGEIGGIYTIDIAPGETYFLVKGDKIQNSNAAGYPFSVDSQFGFQSALADTPQFFVATLLTHLRQR